MNKSTKNIYENFSKSNNFNTTLLKRILSFCFWGGDKNRKVDKASFGVNYILHRKWKHQKIESRIQADSVLFKGKKFISAFDQK